MHTIDVLCLPLALLLLTRLGCALGQTTRACQVENQQWLGDGWCDTDAGHNTEECGWDGGDCCPSTCSGFGCLEAAFECRDPNLFDGIILLGEASETIATTTDSPSPVPPHPIPSLPATRPAQRPSAQPAPPSAGCVDQQLLVAIDAESALRSTAHSAGGTAVVFHPNVTRTTDGMGNNGAGSAVRLGSEGYIDFPAMQLQGDFVLSLDAWTTDLTGTWSDGTMVGVFTTDQFDTSAPNLVLVLTERVVLLNSGCTGPFVWHQDWSYIAVDVDTRDGRWHNYEIVRHHGTVTVSVDGVRSAHNLSDCAGPIGSHRFLRIGGEEPLQSAPLVDNIVIRDLTKPHLDSSCPLESEEGQTSASPPQPPPESTALPQSASPTAPPTELSTTVFDASSSTASSPQSATSTATAVTATVAVSACAVFLAVLSWRLKRRRAHSPRARIQPVVVVDGQGGHCGAAGTAGAAVERRYINL